MLSVCSAKGTSPPGSTLHNMGIVTDGFGSDANSTKAIRELTQEMRRANAANERLARRIANLTLLLFAFTLVLAFLAFVQVAFYVVESHVPLWENIMVNAAGG